MGSILNFEWVELSNFKSYRGRHKFAFPQSPGLYLLTGKNLVQPRLGANGAGKSSLLDAVFWAFFGRTQRGLRAGDVICHGENTASVAVCFCVSHDRHVVTRRQTPNSLLLDGNVISQEALISAIGLTADQLSYAVMRPQFGEAFFDLAPAAKLTLFSQIMGLDFWLEKSDLAAHEAGELMHRLKLKDDEVSRQEGQFETLEADVTTLEKQIVNDHSKTIAGFEAKLAGVTKKRQLVFEKYQKLNTDKILVHNDIIHITETLQNMAGLKGKCPVCLQTVSGDHLKAQKQRALDHLTLLKTDERAILGRCEASQAEVRSLDRDIAAISQNLNDFKRQQAQFDMVAALIGRKQDELAQLEDSLGGLLDEVDQLKSQVNAIEFWVAGFKRIRLFIIDETLKQLEIEVNNNLASLGLPDWRIEFDVERETKSGGVSKGFVILVYAPLGEQPVRLEAWSGGETQRLRLAGDLGLANLIMDRAGLINTLEVFDEPSSHLSQEGLLDLLDTLQQRAMDHDKVILVVDHHALDYSFDGTFTVVKDKNGSHIEGE